MAQISYTNSSITFGNVTSGTALPGKYYNGNNDYEDFDGKVRSFINAVEIDWNGAKMDANTTINTTW